MAQVNRGPMLATRSDGTSIPYEPKVGCQFVAGQTYYFNFEIRDAPCVGVGLLWAAAFAGVFTLESTLMPKYVNGSTELPWISDVDTSGAWVQQGTARSRVPVTGVGNTSSAGVVTAGGANVGGAEYDLAGFPASRGRIKVVCTTSGAVAAVEGGKDAS